MLEITNVEYRCPLDLAVTPTPLRRIMIIGSCLIGSWPREIEASAKGCPCDFILFNHLSLLPKVPPHPVEEYDFQLVQIPLRAILPDTTYFRLSYQDQAGYEQLFIDSKDRISRLVDALLKWNSEYGLLTFVSNFLLPQQNAMGRLLPRYDLRNPVYFVERLNHHLAECLKDYQNAYLFDFDQIVSTFGRRYIQDDAVWITGHGGAFQNTDFPLDQGRLEVPEKPDSYYPGRVSAYTGFGWFELLAMYRTISRIDAVKLVVVDIDDTLWRGVAAESTVQSPHAAIDGWPLGVIEALCHLKRRGILLAIVSKNDEQTVAPIWKRLLGDRIHLEDFAVRKINWKPKAENFEEILQETNLLPNSAIFIDDNPVERASVKAAFPEVRTFGPNPYVWRRILLWSAEMQVATITNESASRTEMVQAQVQREAQRKKMSREQFLATLGVQMEWSEICDTDHPSFLRAFELINKTNQFNTTGRRWTQAECVWAFANGARLCTFNVTDRFTTYGLVGVLIVQNGHILQFVMSCRVVGLDVEVAAIAEVLRRERDNGITSVTATLEDTRANALCRDLYSRCGFEDFDGRWRRPTDPALLAPAHIQSSVERATPDLERVV